MITAWVIFSPSLASASALSFCRIIAEISGGQYSLPPSTTRTSPFGRLGHLVRHELERLLDLGIVELAAHEALDAEDRVFGVGDRLAAGDLADQALAGLGVDGHDRRGQATALGVLEHGRLAGLHDRHHRVGRAQVNAQYFRHRPLHLSLGRWLVSRAEAAVGLVVFMVHVTTRAPRVLQTRRAVAPGRGGAAAATSCA